MNTLMITRKKSFRAALVPYWIVLSSEGKEKFMEQHHLAGDLSECDRMGQAINRIDVDVLNRVGTVILNGETKQVDITDDIKYIFVVTISGSISNEISINDIEMNKLCITTKGGFKTVSYPFIEEC